MPLTESDDEAHAATLAALRLEMDKLAQCFGLPTRAETAVVLTLLGTDASGNWPATLGCAPEP